ncbi:ABC transporter substrate-binding protein [Haliangium sp.]|uniref:ABC transporter substrate-binding protein n=1 Tax=Haliangium sp. TaxID=2663208 RepID=UPI003D0F7CD1
MSVHPSCSRRRRPRAGIALVALVVTAAAGCEGPPARSKPWRQPVAEPESARPPGPTSAVIATEAERREALQRRAHTLRIHMDETPRHLNPLVTPSRWTLRVAADTVFESLIRFEPPPGGAGAGPGVYQPGLARSWTVAPSGREIRFELQPEVRFHDGTRLSSVDVQFSLDTARSPRGPAEHLQDRLGDIAGVDILGPRTVRVRLSRPNGYVLRALADVPIVPAQVYQGRGRLRAGRGKVVGTGPYRLADWEDDRIRLERNDDYWGPAPAIDHLEFVYEPDAARALTAAKRGEFDLVPALIPAHYPEQASAPGLASEFAPLRLRPPAMRYLVVNAGRPPFDDVRVRHALALLIDHAGLSKEAHDGLARVVAGPIWPGGPGHGPAPAVPDYDPERAGALLDAAGWRDGDGDGHRERAGDALRLVVLTTEDDDGDRDARRDQRERERVLAHLRRSGIQIDRRVGSAAVLRNRLRDGDFDLAFVSWRAGVDRDLAPLLGSVGALNLGRFSEPRVDAVLDALRDCWEPAARAPHMAELARLEVETWPLVALVAPDPYGLVHRRVRGVSVWDGWISLRSLSLDSGFVHTPGAQ